MTTEMHHTASKNLVHIIQELWCTTLPVCMCCIMYKNLSHTMLFECLCCQANCSVTQCRNCQAYGSK